MLVLNLELHLLLDVLLVVFALPVHIGLGSLDWIVFIMRTADLITADEFIGLVGPTSSFVDPQ